MVTLVEIGGSKVITGGNNLASGHVSSDKLPQAIDRIKSLGFAHLSTVGSPGLEMQEANYGSAAVSRCV